MEDLAFEIYNSRPPHWQIYKKKGMSAGAKGARDGTSSKKMRARQKDTDEELEIS
jgi:hypothetical protein